MRMRPARLAAVCAMIALAVVGAANMLDAAAGAAHRAGGAAATARGRTLFVASCGSCHTLRAAHTRATAGPNLDRAFRRVKKAKVRRIVRRVTARGKGAMPAGILTGSKAATVAAYVA
jgi:mono/diheme cytochrome c family protein